MPRGLAVIEWDDQKGPLLYAQHPEGLELTGGLLNQIYGAHRYASLESGTSAITFQGNKVVSFFSGMKGNIVGEPNFVVAMLLLREESQAKFMKLLVEKAPELLQNIKGKNSNKLITRLYEEMKAL